VTQTGKRLAQKKKNNNPSQLSVKTEATDVMSSLHYQEDVLHQLLGMSKVLVNNAAATIEVNVPKHYKIYNTQVS
jgi:hypothetical protein